MKLSVTGLGIVSPLGVGRTRFWEALDGDDPRAVAFGGTPTIVSAAVARDTRVAEVWGFDPGKYLGAKGHRNFDRLTKLQIIAARHALEDAGIKADGAFLAYEPARVGVCSATAYGSLDEITELNRVAELEDPRYINPTRFPNTVINSAAGYVSIWEDLRAPNTTIADGNTGALDGVLHAAVHLEQRRADAMVVGGGEVVNDALVLAMHRLGVSTNVEFGVGEGSVFLVVERDDSAAARGAQVFGRVLGYGSGFGAPEREALVVHAAADVAVRAYRDALADAGVAASDVDLLVTAASGIPLFDDAERNALDTVFGEGPRRLHPKLVLGESFGAAGAFGMAVALREFEASRARVALVSSIGYYGNVSAVVLARPA